MNPEAKELKIKGSPVPKELRPQHLQKLAELKGLIEGGSQQGALALINECIEYINIPDDQGLTALHTAAQIGNTKIVEAVLQTKRCDINAKSIEHGTPLYSALAHRHEQVAITLLAEPEIEIDRLTQLQLLNRRGSALQTLFKSPNANVNMKDRTGA